MPMSPDGLFSRIWKFVDRFDLGDKVTRSDLDIAFDDISEALSETSQKTKAVEEKLPDGEVVGTSDVQTLSNKTLENTQILGFEFGHMLRVGPNGTDISAVRDFLKFEDQASFSSSDTTYADLPNGESGGDIVQVGGQSWVTLPASTPRLFLQSAGGVKARRNQPPFVLLIAGQSNAAGANDDGPNPASTLVGSWDAVTSSVEGSDRTAEPWSYSNPNGNNGNNNYALAYAHYIADTEGRAVIIVFDAVGGTSIDEWVASGTSSTRYSSLKAKTEAALADAGLTQVDAMIWAQGEEDFQDSFAEHLGNLTTLVTQLRGEAWFANETPIYMMGPSDLHDRYQWQEAMQYFCGKVDSRCIYVPSSGLRTEYSLSGSGDYTHFLGESLWEGGYHRIPVATPTEHNAALFLGPGTGLATPLSQTVLATFGNFVSRQSWTDENPANGPASVEGASWGFECFADGNYSWALGYQCTTDNLANYGAVIGRDVGATENADYFGGFGYQVTLDAAYTFGAGRGHTVADDYGSALGGFTRYTTVESDPVRLQVGLGTSTSNRNNGLTVRQSGAVEIATPPQVVDPSQNGELLFRKVDGDNAKIELAFRGTDGTVRTIELALT